MDPEVLACYVVGAVAGMVVGAVLIASATSNKKTAADATGLSQTGDEGATATEQPPPQEAPKSDAKGGVAPASDLAAIAAAFDYSKNPLDMPDELVMPEFGTVRQQAAFALGCAAQQSRRNPFSFSAMCSNAAADPKKLPGEIPLAVFAGMCQTIGHNSVELLIRATYGKDKESANRALEVFGKIRPDAEWQACLKKAVKLLVYCGAATDALNLYSRFGPEGADYAEELSKLLDEQADFAEAVEEALPELRKWLAAHTDKDEFKQEPVYLEDTGANKVDDVIPEQSNAANEAAAHAASAAPAQP